MAIECSESIVYERGVSIDVLGAIPILFVGALIGVIAVDTLTGRSII